jgi:hypothetical protein
MTKLATVVTGDVDDARVIVIGQTVAGAFVPIDFTGLVDEVEAHVWRQGVDSVTLAAAFTDEAAGELTVQFGDDTGWLATLVLPAGKEYKHLIEYQVTYLDGGVKTWGPDTLPVRGQAT